MKKGWMSVIVAISAVLFGSICNQIGGQITWKTLIVASCFIIVIAFVTKLLFSKNEKCIFIEIIGYSSMCTYLFHRPVYWLISKMVGPIDIKIAFVVFVPIVIAVGYMLQRAYDKIIEGLH